MDEDVTLDVLQAEASDAWPSPLSQQFATGAPEDDGLWTILAFATGAAVAYLLWELAR